MSLIDDIKRDREAGTPGQWVAEIGGKVSSIHAPDATEYTDVGYLSLHDHAGNARRIARVPDMEAALLAADEFYNHILGAIDIIADGKPNTGIGQIYVALAEYEKAVK